MILKKNRASKMEQTLEIQENKNIKVSINYTYIREIWNCEVVDIDDVFSFVIAIKIMNGDNFEPSNVDKCKQRHDCPFWEEVLQEKLASLTKYQVFWSIVQTPKDVQPNRYKQVFMRKKNEIIIYKAKPVA